MHQAARSSDENVAGVTASADEAVEGRKFIRKITSLIIVAGAVLITLYVWGIIERHPRTDDATARANVVGIAPRVAGQILKLNVQDNQAVKEGDVLFEIDPEDYRLVLEKAKADLAALDRQIAQAHSTLQRLEPLLPKKFTTAENVDEARTKLTTLQAQREGVVATINLEELHLSYCKVIAPFSGRVINLNISAGAHVTTGVPVFSLLDTSKWYVIANFREAEIRHMAPGSEAIVYLSSAPNQRFRGKVQGIGWAVKPEGEIDLPPSGVPYVKRELNWVRVAQRFPVRIEVENPDQDLFRMGASAVAIIDGPPRHNRNERDQLQVAERNRRLLPFGSLEWFKRELAPTPERARRTAIMVAAAVLCVIISMTLQVPELSVTAYMPFFMSKESKFLTTLTGVIGLIGLTIGIGVSLLLYKFTYGHPELRIPGMAIALFLGMWVSRIFVLGPLGFLIGFVVAVSQSVGEAVPSPELLVRGLLWLWVAIAYGAGLTVVLNLLFLPDAPGPPAHLPKPKSFFVSGRVH